MSGLVPGSVLNPDIHKNQIIHDPETGESKAKMTEVKKLKLNKNMKLYFSTKEQAVLAREIRRRGKNKVGFSFYLIFQ